jgi:hypothetical protein
MPPSTAMSIFGSTEFKLFFVIQCLTSVIRVLSWAPYLKRSALLAFFHYSAQEAKCLRTLRGDSTFITIAMSGGHATCVGEISTPPKGTRSNEVL